jgi:cell division protein FtsI/penicillin-binding protein 2
MGIFIALGCVALILLGRIAQLQITSTSIARAEVALRSERVQKYPAARGSMVDRHGQAIAYDRAVYETRAELLLPLRSKSGGDALATSRTQFLGHVFAAFGQDPKLQTDREAHRNLARKIQWRLDSRIDRAYASLQEKGQLDEKRFLKADFLLHPALDNERVVQALRSLDQRSNPESLYSFYLHLRPTYERVYADRELTAGIAGTVELTSKPDPRNGDPRRGKSGLERLRIMSPGTPGIQRLLVNALEKGFWTGGALPPDTPHTLRTTLDLELQRLAQDLLQGAADKVEDKYGSVPDWGAMLAVDVATGDILAAASYQAGENGENNPYGAFAPMNRVFPPGSVVKPLHIALGLQRGKFNWQTQLDCSPGFTLRWRRAWRRIVDSHPSGMLDPYGIILNSSNIGAVKLALMSGSQVLEEYLQRYQLGSSLCLNFPGESVGTRPDQPIYELTPANQLVYTGPSIGFGYELGTTALQVARAYLTLLSGRSRELRLVTHVMQGDEVLKDFPVRMGEPFLSSLNVSLVKSAMAGVMNAEPGSTARSASEWLRKQGIPKGYVGGKTGTSEYEELIRSEGKPDRTVVMRTASYVGFAPVDKPEVLVLCVVQKPDASLFYGGSYAAPAALRLLLAGLDRGRERHDIVHDQRVSVSWTGHVPDPAPGGAGSRDENEGGK